MSKDILKGYKVIELASVLAGPLVGSFCAELGARVIKIENVNTRGDITRSWKLPEEDPESPTSAYYASANFNKEVLMLDLKSKGDYQILLEEMEDADIVLSNYQKNTAEKLKIDFQTLKFIKTDLIFIQLNAFEYEDLRSGYDLVMQAETGYISMCGTRSGELVKMPVALIDVLAAHQMKEALLMALFNKLRTGKGSVVHVSLFKSGISALANQAGNFLSVGHIPKPIGTLHPNIAPYGEVFTTLDGIMFILAVGSDGQFKKLGKTLKLANDKLSYFCNNQNRVTERSKLYEVLAKKFREKEWEELKKDFDLLGIPYGQVKNLKEVFQSDLASQMVKRRKDGYAYVSNIAFEIIMDG